MRIFFSVGEPSGDLHGSNLIRHLTSQQWEIDGELLPSFECVGFGGPKMQSAGCELLCDLTQQAVMFFEALKNLPFFVRLIGQADQYFAQNKVDAVVLIDYAGFNWWIARKAKKYGIPVFFYGVPQVWAWAPWRIRKIQNLVDHVLCKLPFEKDWFEQRNCNATYVGHPYFDEIENHQLDDKFLGQLNQQDGPLLTLLPGSRDQEVRAVLPVLISSAAKVAQQVPKCRVSIASFNQKQAEMAESYVRKLEAGGTSLPKVNTVVGRTPELMRAASVCLACSGSVSMELMHYRKPTIIAYKVSRWMMMLQSLFLKAKYITLVNLIDTRDIRKTSWAAFDPDAAGAERVVMPEYLTSGDPSEKIAARAIQWLTNESSRQATVNRLDQLAKMYARPGATVRAAEYLVKQIYPEATARPSISQNIERIDSAIDTRKTA